MGGERERKGGRGGGEREKKKKIAQYVDGGERWGMGRREIDSALTSTTQEVFCIGTELSLRALEEIQHILTESASSETADNLPRPLLNQRWSLMSLASKGAGRVPLDAVVKFVRVARSYNQKEVVEMLAEHVIKITKV